MAARRCVPCDAYWPTGTSFNNCPKCLAPADLDSSATPDIEYGPATRVVAAWNAWREHEAAHPSQVPDTEFADTPATRITELELAYAIACRRDGTRAVHS